MHAVGHALVALFAGGIAVAHGADVGNEGRAIQPPGRRPATARRPGFFLAALGLARPRGQGSGRCVRHVRSGLTSPARSGGELRLELLDALLTVHRLRRPRHADQGGTPREPAGGRRRRRSPSASGRSRSGWSTGCSAASARGRAARAAGGGARASSRRGMAAVAASVLGGVRRRCSGGCAAATSERPRARPRERERLLEAADESVRHADLWVSYGARGQGARRASGRWAARSRAGAARLRGARGGDERRQRGARRGGAARGHRRRRGRGGSGALANGAALLAFAVAFFLAYRPLRELADARLALARAEAAFGELRGGHRSRRAGRGAVRPASSRSRVEPSPGLERWAPARSSCAAFACTRGERSPLSLRAEPGIVVAIAGPDRRRQDDAAADAARARVGGGGRRALRRASRSATRRRARPRGPSRGCRRKRRCSPIRCDENVGSAARDADPRERARPRSARRTWPASSRARVSAREDAPCRAASGSGLRWRAPSRRVSPCCCSTSPRAVSTRSRSGACSTPSRACAASARCSS